MDVILQQAGGEPLLWPNALCFGPDGPLYVSDSGFRIGDLVPNGRVRQDYMELPINDRVFRVDLETLQAEEIDSGLSIPKGPRDWLDPTGGLLGRTENFMSPYMGRARSVSCRRTVQSCGGYPLQG